VLVLGAPASESLAIFTKESNATGHQAIPLNGICTSCAERPAAILGLTVNVEAAPTGEKRAAPEPGKGD
jgi:hypothetical protein